jgi:hypothetical protein
MNDTSTTSELTADLFDPLTGAMDAFWEESREELLGNPFPGEGLVHHYTTVEAAISIIKSQSLWSTNIAFLNDFNERICASNVLRRMIHEVEKCRIFADKEANELATQLLSKIENEFVHSSFVTSFCDDGDLLGQWRGYGGGVSIAFDAKALNASFRDEREWRLLTTRPLGDLNAPPEVHFRAREKAISPYVELNPVNGKLPIRGIILSPNCHSTASACFEAMLAKHGYEDAFVNFSEIPYRD